VPCSMMRFPLWWNVWINSCSLGINTDVLCMGLSRDIKLKTSFQSNIDRISTATLTKLLHIFIIWGSYMCFETSLLNIDHLINHFLSVFEGLQNFKLLRVLNSCIIKEITQRCNWHCFVNCISQPKRDKNSKIVWIHLFITPWASVYCWFHSEDIWISLFTFLITTYFILTL
jgi:hypothetical protein